MRLAAEMGAQALRSLVVLLIHQVLGVHASSTLARPSGSARPPSALLRRGSSRSRRAAGGLLQAGLPELPSQGVGSDGCRLLQQAFLMEPKGSCEEVRLYDDWEGCSCKIEQPRSMNPWPDTFYDPSAITVKDHPTFPPVPSLAPPFNPRGPYVAPRMEPQCPFSRQCAGKPGTDCVGFDSWGFKQLRLEPYSAAAGHFKSITCTYMMDKDGHFQVPGKVAALWASQKQALMENQKQSR